MASTANVNCKENSASKFVEQLKARPLNEAVESLWCGVAETDKNAVKAWLTAEHDKLDIMMEEINEPYYELIRIGVPVDEIVERVTGGAGTGNDAKKLAEMRDMQHNIKKVLKMLDSYLD